MKMNRITISGVLAVLALIMAPGFTAQAAPPVDPGLISIPGGAAPAQTVNPDTSPDVAGTAGDVETPDVEVEDDVAEINTPDVEDIEVADIGDIETPDVGDIEVPDIEAPEVEAPEVETPELGE